MKKTIIASVFALFAGSAVSAPVMWGNVYSDLLINENASQKETQILGIEGGVFTDKTDVYGFFEHNPNLENEFGKMTIHTKVFGDFGVYGRASMFKEGGFSEDRYIMGAGYQGFVGENYAIKPYIGALRIDIDDCATDTQAAFGYSGFYVTKQGVTISSWVDARVDESKVKASGSVGLQTDMPIIAENAYVGAFYNMNYHEQGLSGFSDSVQLRVGYHF